MAWTVFWWMTSGMEVFGGQFGWSKLCRYVKNKTWPDSLNNTKIFCVLYFRLWDTNIQHIRFLRTSHSTNEKPPTKRVVQLLQSRKSFFSFETGDNRSSYEMFVILSAAFQAPKGIKNPKNAQHKSYGFGKFRGLFFILRGGNFPKTKGSRETQKTVEILRTKLTSWGD